MVYEIIFIQSTEAILTGNFILKMVKSYIFNVYSQVFTSNEMKKFHRWKNLHVHFSRGISFTWWKKSVHDQEKVSKSLHSFIAVRSLKRNIGLETNISFHNTYSDETVHFGDFSFIINIFTKWKKFRVFSFHSKCTLGLRVIFVLIFCLFSSCKFCFTAFPNVSIQSNYTLISFYRAVRSPWHR